MKWIDYFMNASGTGILGTADASGRIDQAIYARPHVTDEGEFAFVMRPRRSYANLQQNPQAGYMFIEKSFDHKGYRFYMEKTREANDPALVDEMRWREPKSPAKQADSPLVVFFRIVEVRPLVGDGPL